MAPSEGAIREWCFFNNHSGSKFRGLEQGERMDGLKFGEVHEPDLTWVNGDRKFRYKTIE